MPANNGRRAAPTNGSGDTVQKPAMCMKGLHNDHTRT